MEWRPSAANWKAWLKLLGLAALVAYAWNEPITIEPRWVATYLGISLAVAAIFTLAVVPILDRVFPRTKLDVRPYAKDRVDDTARHPWLALLLPGEDGLFFVPLLMIGIEPAAAVAVAITYAAFHWPEYPVKHCASKAVQIFLVAWFVLPHGIGSVVVGHVVLDVLGFLALRKIMARAG